MKNLISRLGNRLASIRLSSILLLMMIFDTGLLLYLMIFDMGAAHKLVLILLITIEAVGLIISTQIEQLIQKVKEFSND